MRNFPAAISTTCICILLSALFLIHFASALGCVPGYACFKEADDDDQNMNYNRKMLMDLVGSSRLTRGGGGHEGKLNDEVEMRNVPNGPDPLHHNGGPQKRPRISP